MSQELLYTSAPRGLKPGSRGFCTVLCTQGMPAPLASAVEALSGYRPVYPSNDERAARNPVVYSHLKMQATGKTWHVLSRIADHGLDYSQRPNKLAHHVILDNASERLAGGPANLLLMPGFMRDEWQGDPKVVALKPVTREPRSHSGICEQWKEVTGDAGWAGVLAESFLADPERLVILLYEPGQQILPLLTEAISLLPVARRWDVTFSTYFTSLAAGTTCVWRAMIHDSKEAHESLRFVNAMRVDLTNDALGTATGGRIVEAARSGNRLTEVTVETDQPRTQVRDELGDQLLRSHGLVKAAVKDEDFEAVPKLQNPPQLATTHAVSGSPVPPRKRGSGKRLAEANMDGSRCNRWKFRLPIVMSVVFLITVTIMAFVTRNHYLNLARSPRESNSTNSLSSTNEGSASQDIHADDGHQESTPSISSTGDGGKTATMNDESGKYKDETKTESTAPRSSAGATDNTVETQNTNTAALTEKQPSNGNITENQPLSRDKTYSGSLIRLPSKDEKPVSLYEFPPGLNYPINKLPGMHLFKPRWLPYVDGKANEALEKSHNALWQIYGKGTEGNVPIASFFATRETNPPAYKLKALSAENVKWLGWYRIQVLSNSSSDPPLRELKFCDFPIRVRQDERDLRNGSVRWTFPKAAPINSSNLPQLHLDRLTISIEGKSYDVGVSSLQPGAAWEVECGEATSQLYASFAIDAVKKPKLTIEVKLTTDEDESYFEIQLRGKAKLIDSIKTSLESQVTLHKSALIEACQMAESAQGEVLKPKVEEKLKGISVDRMIANEVTDSIGTYITEAIQSLMKRKEANPNTDEKMKIDKIINSLKETHQAFIGFSERCRTLQRAKTSLDHVRLCAMHVSYVLEDTDKNNPLKPIMVDVVDFDAVEGATESEQSKGNN